jgi:hypothetical protein
MRPSETLPRPYDLSRSQGDQRLDHSLLLLYRPAALKQRRRRLHGGDPGRSWPIRHINTLIRNATTQRRSTDDSELVQPLLTFILQQNLLASSSRGRSGITTSTRNSWWHNWWIRCTAIYSGGRGRGTNAFVEVRDRNPRSADVCGGLVRVRRQLEDDESDLMVSGTSDRGGVVLAWFDWRAGPICRHQL